MRLPITLTSKRNDGHPNKLTGPQNCASEDEERSYCKWPMFLPNGTPCRPKVLVPQKRDKKQGKGQSIIEVWTYTNMDRLLNGWSYKSY